MKLNLSQYTITDANYEIRNGRASEIIACSGSTGVLCNQLPVQNYCCVTVSQVCSRHPLAIACNKGAGIKSAD